MATTRPLVTCAVQVVTILTSATASAFSFDGLVRDRVATAALIADGGGCYAGRCTESVASGFAPVSVPSLDTTVADASLGSGTSTMRASATAQLYLPEPDANAEAIYGPGIVAFGNLYVGTTIQEAHPDEVHTAAEAAASIDDRLFFTVPALEPDDRFSILLQLTRYDDGRGLTEFLDGTASIIETGTEESIFSASATAARAEYEIDLSAYAGSQLALRFDAEAAIAGSKGFGGAMEPRAPRSFGNNTAVLFVFRHEVVPEPSTGALLGLGLGLLALRSAYHREDAGGRRRRAVVR